MQLLSAFLSVAKILLKFHKSTPHVIRIRTGERTYRLEMAMKINRLNLKDIVIWNTFGRRTVR